MGKKALDFSTVIRDIRGDAYKVAVDKDTTREYTLADAVYTYLTNVDAMRSVTQEDRVILYTVAVIAVEGGVQELTTAQYDSLKRIVDDNRATLPQQGELPVLSIMQHVPVKKLVDSATPVKDRVEK